MRATAWCLGVTFIWEHELLTEVDFGIRLVSGVQESLVTPDMFNTWEASLERRHREGRQRQDVNVKQKKGHLLALC